MRKPNVLSIPEAVFKLQEQQVIAYPTEAVFGLGCDPDSELAIQTLLNLKQRAPEKGLILVAANFGQLQPYVNESLLSEAQRQAVLQSWPGPVTWIMPKQPNVLEVLSGQFDTLAVRVSAHPVVQALCQAFGKPIVSTSANLSGYAPCLTAKAVHQQFGDAFPVLDGQVGGSDKPTEIRHSLTNQIIRQG